MIKSIVPVLLLSVSSLFAGTTAAPSKMPIAPPPVPAETNWEFLAGYDSQYNFRGTNYGKNLSYADLGYTFHFSDALSAEIGVWYAVVPSGVNGKFQEADYYLTMDYELSKETTIGLGYTHYTYSGINWADEPEIMAHVSQTVGPVDLNLLYAHDFEVKGDFWQLTASKSFELCDKCSLEPSVFVAANNHYFMKESGGSHFGVSVGAPISISANAVIRPYITAQWAIDAAKDAGLVHDEVFGGVSLTVGF